MIDPMSSIRTSSSVAPQAERDEKLRKVATQLEGMFVQQMFKAMRETVPQQEGIVSGGTGEELFTSLMDQHLAAETPRHWEGGLAEAVYRQLRTGVGEPVAVPQLSESAQTTRMNVP
jgi:flagellar protein FlgJ